MIRCRSDESLRNGQCRWTRAQRSALIARCLHVDSCIAIRCVCANELSCIDELCRDSLVDADSVEDRCAQTFTERDNRIARFVGAFAEDGQRIEIRCELVTQRVDASVCLADV
jgi:hypothetical protein